MGEGGVWRMYDIGPRNVYLSRRSEMNSFLYYSIPFILLFYSYVFSFQLAQFPGLAINIVI